MVPPPGCKPGSSTSINRADRTMCADNKSPMVVDADKQLSLFIHWRRQAVLKAKKTMPELTNNSSFRVPNPTTASVVLVAHKETHSRSVVKLPQPFPRLDNGAQHSKCVQCETSGFTPRAPRTASDRLMFVSASCCAHMSLHCTPPPIRLEDKSYRMAPTALVSNPIVRSATPFHSVVQTCGA